MKIYNNTDLINFLETCMPTLEKDELLIYFLFVRKKYCPEVKNHHQMVFRDLLTNTDPNFVIDKICKIPDEYRNYDTGQLYQEDCLSLYIDLNPKSGLKGYYNFQNKMNKMFYDTIKNPSLISEFQKIKKHFYSSIHKSTSRNSYIMIDVDSKDLELLEALMDALTVVPIWVSETRGGYHFIYNKTSQACKEIYLNLKDNYWRDVEIKSEVMTPIVGTKQGGFKVKDARDKFL